MSRPKQEFTPVYVPKSDEDTFARVSHALLSSMVFMTLPASETKLYMNVVSRFSGTNNGLIVLGAREAAASTEMARNTVMRAFKELERKGFLIRRYMGEIIRGKDGLIGPECERLASEWEITDVHTYDGERAMPAKRTYLDFDPTAGNQDPGKGPTGAIVAGLRSAMTPQPYRPKAKARKTTRAKATKVEAEKPSGTVIQFEEASQRIRADREEEQWREAMERAYDRDEERM